MTSVRTPLARYLGILGMKKFENSWHMQPSSYCMIVQNKDREVRKRKMAFLLNEYVKG